MGRVFNPEATAKMATMIVQKVAEGNKGGVPFRDQARARRLGIDPDLFSKLILAGLDLRHEYLANSGQASYNRSS